jgi:cyclase
VAFIGDLAFIGRDPLIHRDKGGTSLGLVRALTSLLALDADLYVPGHNPPLTKPDIDQLGRSIADKRAKVADLVAQGKSLDEIKAAFGIGPETAPPGARRWPSLVEVIYQELTGIK